MSNQKVEVLVREKAPEDFHEISSGAAKWQICSLLDGIRNFRERYDWKKEELLESLEKYGEEIAGYNAKQISNVALDYCTRFIVSQEYQNSRELQYIYVGKKIEAVATLQHVIIDRYHVRGIIEARLEELNVVTIDPWVGFEDIAFVPGAATLPWSELKIGGTISLGNNILTKAIRFSIMGIVEVCLNPLTFIGGIDTSIFGEFTLAQEKVLRVKKKQDLIPKIHNALDSIIADSDALPKVIEERGNESISLTDAAYIVSATCTAYGIGQKVRANIVSEFSMNEKKIWGLGMAFSESSVIPHEQIKIKSQKTRAKLSAIAMMILTHQDKNQLVECCIKHVKKNKLPLDFSLAQEINEP